MASTNKTSLYSLNNNSNRMITTTSTGIIRPIAKSFNIPTTQDSLALYYNSNKVNNSYDSSKYKTTSRYKIESPDDVHSRNDFAIERFGKRNNGPRVPTKDGTVERVALEPDKYSKQIDSNKYMMREIANGILDTRKPMRLFDRRINPTETIMKENIDKNDLMYKDQITEYAYNPIVIKPAAMKTKQDWEYIRKNYPEYYPKNNTNVQRVITNKTVLPTQPIVKQQPIQQVVQPTVQAIQQAPAQQENWNTINNPISYSMNGKTMYSTQDKFGELFKDRIAFYKEKNVSDEVANKLIEQEYKVRKKDTTLVPDDATQKAINVRATNLYKK